MVNVPVVAKRELHTYFLSPIAYVMLTAFALAHGVLFSIGFGMAVDPNDLAARALGLPLTLLVFAIPILTMRLLSEEASRGTIETLMTTPVTEAEVVLGKFLGGVVFAVVMYVPILVEITFLGFLGTMDFGPLLSGFLGLFLLTAQFIAVGLFCSALTRVQIASAIVTFVALLALYVLEFVSRDSTLASVQVLRYLSPARHYYDFLKGLVDTRALAYYAITTAGMLFLTVKALELRKWR